MSTSPASPLSLDSSLSESQLKSTCTGLSFAANALDSKFLQAPHSAATIAQQTMALQIELHKP
jgi:hypothetical protein